MGVRERVRVGRKGVGGMLRFGVEGLSCEGPGSV